MTKYYYSCPLKAAYMAKYFAMMFTTTDSSVVSAYEISQRFLDGGSNDNFRFYICPDSMHMLEAIEGDVAQGGDGSVWIVNNVCALQEYCIIQRNSVALMQPEIDK